MDNVTIPLATTKVNHDDDATTRREDTTMLTTILTIAATTALTAGCIWCAIVLDQVRRHYAASRYMAGLAGYQKCEDGVNVYVAYHGHKAAALSAARDAEEDFGVCIAVK